MAEEHRQTQKIMTKEHFEKVKDKYRDISEEAASCLEGAQPEDRFAFTLVEGSRFAVEEATKIEDTEDLIAATTK